MILWPSLAFCLSFVCADDPSDGDSQPAQAWFFRWGATVRTFAGSTKVREFDSQPQHLDFDRDLGLDTDVGMHFELGRETDHLQLVLEADMFGPSGSGQLDHDFAYDEATFAGNQPFDVASRFLFVRGSVAFKQAFGAGDERHWFGPLLGFEYPNLSLEIEQGTTLTKEYWWQFLPYPIVGLAGVSQLDATFRLEARVFGTYVHRWPTLFEEGGRIAMSARTVTAQVLLSANVADWFGVDLGLQYQYWQGELHSHEDGNEMTLRSPALILGLHARF